LKGSIPRRDVVRVHTPPKRPRHRYGHRHSPAIPSRGNVSVATAIGAMNKGIVVRSSLPRSPTLSMERMWAFELQHLITIAQLLITYGAEDTFIIATSNNGG
jgi:hypothetical protein